MSLSEFSWFTECEVTAFLPMIHDESADLNIGKAHTCACVCFPNHHLKWREATLQAVSSTPHLNWIIFGCECVQTCVLSTTLKDADIPRRLNSRAREKYGLVHGCYISDDELTAVSSSLHKVKFGSCL